MENIRGEGGNDFDFLIEGIAFVEIEIVASRVICLSSTPTISNDVYSRWGNLRAFLLNISKYFTILIKKKRKKKRIEEISQLWKKRGEQYSFGEKKKRRRRRSEWVSEFLFFRSFFSPGEIQIFLVEIIIIRASIIGPCKEVSTTRKRRIPARCFISSARFSARDWFIYRDGRRACPSTTLDAVRCWLIRLLSGSGGKEEASRRTAHSDPSFPVETPSTTLSGRKVSLSIQSRRSRTVLLIPNRISFEFSLVKISPKKEKGEKRSDI